MSDTQTRLYAWLGKWGDALSAQARAEFRSAVGDQTADRPALAPLEQNEKLPAPANLKQPKTERRPIDFKKPCRRGDMTTDPKTGQTFPHQIDQTLKYCLWCGEGLPPTKESPDPGANLLERGMVETVPCDEHGSHQINVRPDGTFDKPECRMFDNAPAVQP